MSSNLQFLPESFDVDFVMATAERVKFCTAATIGKVTLGGLNIRHFVNSYCKRRRLEPFCEEPECILDFCHLVPDTYGSQWVTVGNALKNMSSTELPLLGFSPEAAKFKGFLAKIEATDDRSEKAVIAQAFMEFVRTDGLELMTANSVLKCICIEKCKELHRLHWEEFPALAAACAAALADLDPPIDAVLDSIVLKNLSTRPLPTSFRVSLQMEDFDAESGLLYPKEMQVYSRYYGRRVSLFQHFNRYKKVNCLPGRYTLPEILKYYFVDTSETLYDTLLNWNEELWEHLEPCSEEEFACDCCAEIAALRRRIEALEAAEKKRTRLAATE